MGKSDETTSSAGLLAVTFQPLAVGGVLRSPAPLRFNWSDIVFIVLFFFSSVLTLLSGFTGHAGSKMFVKSIIMNHSKKNQASGFMS